MERNLAVLIDFENIATGCEKEGLGRFDMRIVMRRLKDKGRILVARSYADWGRWNRFKLDLVHEGITMVELTSHGMQSKNRADIALAVDAMELAYTRNYVDTFVILSGDSDFTPLVMRLKELNKRVIGCGTRQSTSRLIAETCDEFFFYDTLRNESRLEPPKPAVQKPEEAEEDVLTLDEALELLVETVENHLRDDPTPVHASVLKASMKRKEPTFNEVELGLRSFARFLETAAQKGLVVLSRDERAGGVRVELPQDAQKEAPPAAPRLPKRTLGPDAQRLQGLLAEGGLELGDPTERKVIVEQFVATCAERARRNRSCAVQFILGDLLRRVKQEAPEIAPRSVKAVAHAILRAGLLIHPNGEPARATTAPFVAPESATQLLDELHGAGLRMLQSRGENPDDEVLTELFVGEKEEPKREEPKGGNGSREGRGRGRDRGGRREPRVEAEPTPPPVETIEAELVPTETREEELPPSADGENVEAPPRGGKSRRGKASEPKRERPARRKREPVEAAPAPEPAPEPEPSAVTTEEPEGEAETEGGASRRRRRGGRRGRRPSGGERSEG